MGPQLALHASGAVALITLDDAASRNAIGSEIARRLDGLLVELDRDDGVRVVVITGREPAFCSGMDLRDVGAGTPIDLTFIDRVATLSKTTIAAVNGVAATGGLELALACTIRFAAADAWFVDRHAELGLFPKGGLSARLPRLVPLSTALDITLSARRVSAHEALTFGLVDRVLPSEGFVDAVCSIAAKIATLDPDLERRIVETYRESARLGLEDALAAEQSANASWHAGAGDRASASARFREMREDHG